MEMEDLAFYENQFIKADSLIAEGKISEAKEILEEILEQYPDFGKAHNHIGWIYYNKLSDYDKAILHYKLAIKFDPKYTASYINHTYVLVDIGRYKEAKDHIATAFNTLESIDYATFYGELGRIAELEFDYITAYKNYSLSKKHAFNPQFIENMNINNKRVYDKMSIFEKLKVKFK